MKILAPVCPKCHLRHSPAMPCPGTGPFPTPSEETKND